jgi:hypothetical protein
MMEFSEVLHLDCDCTSAEHTVRFVYQPDEEYFHEDGPLICMDVNLVQYRGFWKRLWYGIKYVFGHKSRYGPFSEFVMNKKNATELITFIEQAYSHNEAPE